MKRLKGCRGLTTVKNCLYEYVRTKPEPVIKEVEKEAILEPGKDKKSIKEEKNLKKQKFSQHILQ